MPKAIKTYWVELFLKCNCYLCLHQRSGQRHHVSIVFVCMCVRAWVTNKRC